MWQVPDEWGPWPWAATRYTAASGGFLFPPLKGLGIEWHNKCPLSELDTSSDSATAFVADAGQLLQMSDGLDSASAPVYCATIADAKAEYSATQRNLVELQCRPFGNPTTGQFTLGQDDPSDSITVYYTGSAALGVGRINRIVGTIQKDASDNYWIEVDSGPNWTEGDTVGSVQAVAEGSIAWAKTFADGNYLTADLSENVVSRTFPASGYFYVQEPSRAWGKVTATGNGYYYIDDGSNLSDGSGPTGICVEGVIPYAPDTGDCVAVSGISGLVSLSSGLAPVVRVASGLDFTPVTPARPDGVAAYATGPNRITVYWNATLGATAYSVYAGTASGQESSVPLNATVHQSGEYFCLTHENLTEGQDYYYLVRATSPSGVSAPSDEVTSLVQSWYGSADYVKVIRPDGRVFESTQSTPLAPEGSIIEGTNLYRFTSGQVIPLSDAYWSVETLDNGESETLAANGPITPHYTLNSTDGPYRRVSSKMEQGYTFCGGQGWFYAPNRNGMHIIGDKTTPYIYLGSHHRPDALGTQESGY